MVYYILVLLKTQESEKLLSVHSLVFSNNVFFLKPTKVADYYY